MDKRLFSVTDLETKGFLALPYPQDLREAVVNTIGTWQAFCDLPVTLKRALPYSNAGAGVGYEFKDGPGPKDDHKENFDMTIAGQQWLENQAEHIRNHTALHFVRSALTLIGVMKPSIIKFAKECEKVFELKGFAEEVEDSEAAFFVRFIHYFGERTVGEETATAHTDQSGFTLHLFESAPGLQCLTFEHEWIEMPVSEGETVIIPAMQMQLLSQGRLRALCHRVIATPETAAGGRYSAVCFVQLKNIPKYNKEKYGRLQEKVPGFNYQMSVGEFKQFFKEVT